MLSPVVTRITLLVRPNHVIQGTRTARNSLQEVLKATVFWNVTPCSTFRRNLLPPFEKSNSEPRKQSQDSVRFYFSDQAGLADLKAHHCTGISFSTVCFLAFVFRSQQQFSTNNTLISYETLCNWSHFSFYLSSLQLPQSAVWKYLIGPNISRGVVCEFSCWRKFCFHEDTHAVPRGPSRYNDGLRAKHQGIEFLFQTEARVFLFFAEPRST